MMPMMTGLPVAFSGFASPQASACSSAPAPLPYFASSAASGAAGHDFAAAFGEADFAEALEIPNEPTVNAARIAGTTNLFV